MNKIIITGNVARDAELQYAQGDGQVYTKINVGVSIGTKDQPLTQWYSVLIYGKRAESLAQYIKKGTKLLIEGALKAKAYVNKMNQPVCDLTIYANNIEIITSVQRQEGYFAEETQKEQHKTDNLQSYIDNGECPF